MLRRYRLSVIALVGLIHAAQAQPPVPRPALIQDPQPAAEAHKAEPAPAVEKSQPPVPGPPVPSLKVVEPAKNQRPCKQGEDNRESELCAEWKSADAASDAAWWAKVSFYLGIVGTIGLLANLIYTRAAVRVAQEATDDAEAALAIAQKNADATMQLAQHTRETAERDLRAWVSIGLELVKVSRSREHANFTVKISLKNIGKTPALNIGLSTKIWASNGVTINKGPQPVPAQFPHGMTPLLPRDDASERYGLWMTSEHVTAAMEQARNDHCSVMVTIDAIVHYNTIFDAPGAPRHMTSVRYHAHPAEYHPGNSGVGTTWLQDGPRDLTQVLFARDKDAPALLD